MKKVFIVLYLLVCVNSATAGVSIYQINKYFDGLTDGSFVIYDENSDTYIIYSEKESAVQVSPCSTFKIFNSLIALESGTISRDDNKTLMMWDNEKRSIDSWNKNHKLSSATKNSVVWYFQELAKQIGKESMQRWIDKLEYGNRDLAGGLTKFWLSSSLKISPKEQVELMRKLYNGKLPFATENVNIVKENITLIKNASVHFMGKTGSCSDSDQKIGWFVGAIKRQSDTYYFATNIKSDKEASGVKAKEITESILKSLEILE